MEFILGLITGLVVGFIWGVWRATQSFIERIIERPEEIQEIMNRVKTASQEVRTEMAQESGELPSNEIKAEFHDGVCYLYDHNDKFLAQGPTVTDAIDLAKKRFPGMKFNYRLNESKVSSQ